MADMDDFGFSLGFVTNNPISRAVGDAATSALEVARDAARAVLGTLPGGLGASIEEVVLRAQGTGMYFALVPFMGPQGASVAFAWPGVFRGEAFDKAWFQETLWRSEQALAMSGGDQKLVEAINKQTADGLAKLAGKFPQDVIARMGITEIKQQAQVSRDDVALAIKALADRSERTMAELKALVSAPSFNVQAGTAGSGIAASGGGVLFTADQAVAKPVLLPGGSNIPAIRRVNAGGGPVLSQDDAAAMLVALGFMTDIQRRLAAQGATSVSGSASSPLGKFLASLGQDPRVVAAATLNGATSDMLRNAMLTLERQEAARAQVAYRAGNALSVAQVQQILASVGYDVGPIDGKAGPKFSTALKLFQASAGLAADGIMGPKTDAALRAYVDQINAEREAMGLVQQEQKRQGQTETGGRLMSEQLPALAQYQEAYPAQVAPQLQQQAQAGATAPAASPVPAMAVGGGVGLGLALAAGLAAPVALPVAVVGGALGWLLSKK
jgi:peptidoglycan hydrolase-like protein with peptidoglycan-binding domain